MAKSKGIITIREELCKGCGLCVTACPEDILEVGQRVNERGWRIIELIDGAKCTGCTLCAIACPDAVFDVYRFPKAP